MNRLILFLSLCVFVNIYSQNNVSGVLTNGPGGDYSTLPVELVYFTGNLDSTGVNLLWGTATETNNLGFYILRRDENSQWQKLPDVFIIGHGTSNSPKNYSYLDTVITLNHKYYYYRLQQTDLTGDAEYSDSIQVFLPNALAYFEGSRKSDGVHLQWGTAAESNMFGFDIERGDSSSNASWTKIGFVAGYGNTYDPHDYTFIDNAISSDIEHYDYRLKVISLDGSYEYGDTLRIDFTTSVKDEDDQILPSSLALEQNYPNPFNPVTKIKYTVPANKTFTPTDVVLRIFDMLGKEVATLVNEKEAAGVYQIDFDGSNLASGIYFYRLSAGNKVLTRKMILLK